MNASEPSPHIPLAELDEPWLGARLRTRYQPVVRLADRHAVGVEVLARLDHPAHGTVSPEHFVSQMESAGLAAKLTNAVVTRTFADYPAYLAPLGLTVALNLPLDVLMHPGTLIWLERRRAQSEVPADRIIIELTESQPVDALTPPQFRILGDAVSAARRLGYGIAVDDLTPEMGGYRDLLGLDFSVIKLDKSVVDASLSQGDASAFVASITATAHEAGMRVIAEGVKDKETWNRMLALGVDEAQGYLVARPIPAPGVAVWLEGWMAQV